MGVLAGDLERGLVRNGWVNARVREEGLDNGGVAVFDGHGEGVVVFCGGVNERVGEEELDG